jgi:hypothetical protein
MDLELVLGLHRYFWQVLPPSNEPIQKANQTDGNLDYLQLFVAPMVA